MAELPVFDLSSEEYKGAVSSLLNDTKMGLFEICMFLDSSAPVKPRTWTAEKYRNLEEQKKLGGVDINLALQKGLGDALNYLREGDTIMDWGMGEAASYPLIYLPQNVNVIPVEPQRTAVRAAFLQNRITQNTYNNLITRGEPRYDVADESLDGIIGITSFHSLPATQMQSLAQEFRRILKSNKKICHVQEMAPGKDYLRGISENDLDWVIGYIESKYGGLKFDTSTILGKKSVWPQYVAQVIERFSQTGTWLYDNPQTVEPIFVAEKLDLHSIVPRRNLIDQIVNVMAQAQVIKAREVEKRFDERFTSFSGFLFNTALLIDLVEQIPENKFNKIVGEFTHIMSFGYAQLKHDMFEAYLVKLFNDHGFTVQADRVITLRQDPTKNDFVYKLEGYGQTIPSSSMPGDLISARRVVAVK